MTEDYKKDLLNYITNNFSTTKRNDDQILQEIKSITDPSIIIIPTFLTRFWVAP